MNRPIKDLEHREITAPVLIPEEVDYHGHIYSEDEVRKACRNFNENCNKAALQHKIDLSKEAAYFTESYIAPADMLFGSGENELLVKKGAWIATMKIPSDVLWASVKDGTFKGFSIQAKCMAMDLEKAKVAGRAPAEEGIKQKKRLFDIDFSREDHHVSLVDEAANATELLVVKAKHSPDDPEDKPENPETPDSVNNNKEKEMSLEQTQKEDEILALKKEKAEKEAALAAKELEIQKAKEEKEKSDLEIAELRKEKSLRELELMKEKATIFKADSPEKFAEILQKCKSSLDEPEFEELCKQLGKLSNIEKNKEFFVDKGEGASMSEEKLKKAKEDKFYAKREELLQKGIDRREAARLARLEVEQEK